MQVFQRTIKNSIKFSGIGLHTGKKVNVRIEPAKEDTGIVFVRGDLKGSPSLRVSPEFLSKLFYATTLSNGEISVQTVEHLLAALSAFGIDNVYVVLDSEELPILDGSAAPYVYLLEDTGIYEQSQKRKYMLLKRKVNIENDNKRITAEPYFGLEIDNTISFDHTYKKVRFQRMKYSHSLESFKSIAVARTFCFYQEVEALRAAGLAKGGSLENAIVIGEYDILNEGGLRLDNEFVAHKTLDLVGDLYVLGYPLLAKITAYRTGHALNAAFVRTVYFQNLCEIIELEEGEPLKYLENLITPFAEEQA
ncbi:UDP-3-O-[3-hydroxymyristoyl] N-acetylglucosamine deacetylase [Desulfurobacterium pacificum]|uniref:UDP-3-O-acyl-N-acetylglucosamine deacetylase n=1 Tax=Desulfurobacterium pacificum TaxID=240166 RepID=A0ABY1NBA5_9BACT|nr:UDP-3-O-acyl-N-acetylglucosamine deacetylase [Desulfurobacterium pacificum]SMP05425.1 UDP-3-O-[3-hydroxymyristoyl] N-acetylglucosamine deacetylase [Desulfurobacterium pacificum]